MRWQEQGIILAVKPFSENSRIVTIFNKNIGKTRGLLKGLKASIQLGDICDISWSGRTSEQLGTFKIETLFSPFSFVFQNPMEVLAIESACTLCLNGLPDRAIHENLFEALRSLFFSVTQNNWLIEYVLFEKTFLSEMGIGLDLSKCAVTGKRGGLAYVSPRTGRAVTKEAGEKYKEKLFKLPGFLVDNSKENVSKEDIFCALEMIGHFLKIYFCDTNSKELPLSRNYLIEGLANGAI